MVGIIRNKIFFIIIFKFTSKKYNNFGILKYYFFIFFL